VAHSRSAYTPSATVTAYYHFTPACSREKRYIIIIIIIVVVVVVVVVVPNMVLLETEQCFSFVL
jgi:hypothetical protein